MSRVCIEILSTYLKYSTRYRLLNSVMVGPGQLRNSYRAQKQVTWFLSRVTRPLFNTFYFQQARLVIIKYLLNSIPWHSFQNYYLAMDTFRNFYFVQQKFRIIYIIKCAFCDIAKPCINKCCIHAIYYLWLLDDCSHSAVKNRPKKRSACNFAYSFTKHMENRKFS